MNIDERVSNFHSRVDQAMSFRDSLFMAELVEEGYVLMADVDRELPGEGLEYRDTLANLIDQLCDSITIEDSKIA